MYDHISMSMNIRVEVVYALPDRQAILSVQVPGGTTVRDVIEKSGILTQYPEIDLATNKLGVYAKPVKADTVVRDRDRIEIYRPLIADPKMVRKKRAEEGKTLKKGGGESITADSA